VQTDT